MLSLLFVNAHDSQIVLLNEGSPSLSILFFLLFMIRLYLFIAEQPPHRSYPSSKEIPFDQAIRGLERDLLDPALPSFSPIPLEK